MRYLADILTFSRLILAIVLLMIGVFDTGVDIGVGFVIFMIAELTDAFDGTLATRYPFPKSKMPKYRKYAAKYDMVADALLALAAMVFFTLRVNLVAGLIIAVSYVVAALIIDLVVYEKIFGHPDDCAPTSLMQRNFVLAKKIIMIRRAVYLLLMSAVAVWMLCASGWDLMAKIIIAVIAVIITIFLWFFLSERRHHISRDAVEIEKKLARKNK